MLSSRRATASTVPGWWHNPPSENNAAATTLDPDAVPEPAENDLDPDPRPAPVPSEPGEAEEPAGDGWTDWAEWAVGPDRADRVESSSERAAAPVQTVRRPTALGRPTSPATPPATRDTAPDKPEGPRAEIVLSRQVGWAAPGRTARRDLPWLPRPPRGAKRPRGKQWRRSENRATALPRKPLLSLECSLDSWEPISITEACGFAVRFAMDYLSWDEDEPERRAAALRQYLADPATATIGWSGQGRQRVDLATPGRTVTLANGAVIVVEITARIVLYQRTTAARSWSSGDATGETVGDDDWLPLGEPTPALAFAPASAPPPVAPGWTAGAGWWVQIAVPVRRDRAGQVVVDLQLDPTALSDQ